MEEEEEVDPIAATIMITMAMDREMDKIEIIITTITTITIIVIATKVCRTSLVSLLFCRLLLPQQYLYSLSCHSSVFPSLDY